jgi:oligopeptide/dipeptide ABC transporter ATP-binding protein
VNQLAADRKADQSPLLRVRGLNVSYGSTERPVRAVADADLAIYPGEIVGVAGESGSGKTTLCTAMLRALPSTARIGGSVDFAGRSLFDLNEAEMRRLRGRDIAMILQNPMTSLDPLFTIGNQLGEVLQTHQPKLRGSAARERATELLRRVHITAPESRLRQYPHQMSGGMKQRILTAMATSSSPRLLIADEPTTALDVTIQEEILALFHEIRERAGVAIVIITHDLDVIRRVCDRILVMYAGRIVEDGPVDEVFAAPAHPYTKGLLDSLPHVENGSVVLSSIPGQVPSLSELGKGCSFADRCPRAVPACRESQPPEIALNPAHRAFCHRIEGLT